MTATTSVRVSEDTVTAPEVSDLLGMEIGDVLIIQTARPVIIDKHESEWAIRQDEWPEVRFRSASACVAALTRRLRIS